MPRSSNDGLGRLGGRQKGTPNKKSQIFESLLAVDDINLPSEILKCCENLKPLDKANIYLKLMEYIYPKRKAITIEDSEDSEERVTKINFVTVGSRKDVERLKELEGKEKRLEELEAKYVTNQPLPSH